MITKSASIWCIQDTHLAVDRDGMFEMPRLLLFAPALFKRLAAHVADLKTNHQHWQPISEE